MKLILGPDHDELCIIATIPEGTKQVLVRVTKEGTIAVDARPSLENSSWTPVGLVGGSFTYHEQ